MMVELKGPSEGIIGCFEGEERLETGRLRGRQSSNPGWEEGRASRCEVEGARLEGFLRKKEMPH